jgi:AAA15 family ATPase/GTPase
MLKNYAGFKEESVFNFTRNDGSFKPINMFFGPNGCGKTTGLNAISVLSRAKAYIKRKQDENNLLLRKMQFHPDYDPNYQGYMKYSDKMEILGTFWNGERDLKVHIVDEDVVQNDLFERGQDNCVFIDADHPINMNKFQIPAERVDLFLDLARTIYGYNCFVEKAVDPEGVIGDNENFKEALYISVNHKKRDFQEKPNLSTSQIYQEITQKKASNNSGSFYQDFVIEKGSVRVHFKSMSAGEKKIATLLRNLCDPSVIDKSDIVMVDNLEMHVYFKRHKKMIDKLINAFSHKQFIVTSHSGIMIDHVRDNYGKDCLFDIPVIKNQPFLD